MSEESLEARKQNRKELEAEALTTGKGGLALAGGLLVALGCASLWAVSIVYLSAQWGLFAWVIGSVIGGMIGSLGGRGLGMSIAAAGLAVLSPVFWLASLWLVGLSVALLGAWVLLNGSFFRLHMAQLVCHIVTQSCAFFDRFSFGRLSQSQMIR